MSRHSHDDVPLKIELFSHGEDREFHVNSKSEAQLIFRSLSQKSSRAALYYEEGNRFILTTVLGADEHGVWLEPGRNPNDNQLLLQSNYIVFVSSYHQVKIQFVAHTAAMQPYNGPPAIYLTLPATLLRIQRRDYYRLVTPTLHPLKCAIPVKPDNQTNKREVTVMDISGGGVALVCEESDTELVPGKLYHNCQITIPDTAPIAVDIQVRHTFVITLPSGETRKRAGCQFVNLDGKASILLQRYITQQQQNMKR